VNPVEPHVPEAVWQGTEACVRAYLTGVFARDDLLDGPVSARLTTPHRPWLQELQTLLANFGVMSHIRPEDGQHALLVDGDASVSRFTTRIARIEPAGREAVFDTTQPDGNTVIFNGLVTGQCAEQPLPPYGCCCLGSINLTHFVRAPFEPGATFDAAAFAEVAHVAVRMLDNVLDVTVWPLPRSSARR